MLITVCSNTAELNSAPLEVVTELFSELIRCSRKGHHLLVLNREVCRWVLDNVELDSLQRSCVRSISEQFTQTGSLLKESPVSLSIAVVENPVMNRNKNRFVVDYRTFIRSNFSDKPALIVENGQFDGDFYTIVLQHTRKLENLGCLSFEIVHGGGADTPAQFARVIDNQKIAVCIVDSDKYTPFCSDSDIVRNIKNVNKDDLIGEAYVTACRSLENHIRLDILSELNPELDEKDIQKLKRLINDQGDVENGDCLWLYYNIKGGMNGKTLLERCKTRKDKEWISGKYKIPAKDIGALNYPSFGPKIVKIFIENDAAQAKFHQYIRGKYWSNHFKDYFRQICWFFAADKQRFAT